MNEAAYGALGTFVGSVVTAVVTYLLQRRKLESAEETERKKLALADERADRKQVAGQQAQVFALLSARIATLEARMELLSNEHATCQAENASLRDRVDKLEANLKESLADRDRLRTRVHELEVKAP